MELLGVILLREIFLKEKKFCQTMDQNLLNFVKEIQYNLGTMTCGKNSRKIIQIRSKKLISMKPMPKERSGNCEVILKVSIC